MRRETDFGQGRNGKIDRRGVLAGSEARRSYADFVDDDSLDRSQCIGDAPDAGAAVHSIDVKREFRHGFLPFAFDDTPGDTVRYLGSGLDNKRIMQREGR
jgi:hypothetical protein